MIKLCACKLLQINDVTTKEIPSVLWGPTCAPDKVISTSLPELEVGDWLYSKISEHTVENLAASHSMDSPDPSATTTSQVCTCKLAI